ncbi:hypothetical protein PLESTB_001485400 [Pleodorina starrii]|uniref:Uncharacterized protein n=1 Tax=Pleodorina starrii TaxID=330485 RepID=A0A9W6BWB8_9CHLO|nr:hypothetical protein PLESTM_000657100 [Pleodorina starrii]GLC59432.1 hypothetical protein PLESTB_001485400 [Pleodorina starrii]GLC74372.1 hypothetical protein PLESTF_001506100 [Pleodorina starrii]
MSDLAKQQRIELVREETERKRQLAAAVMDPNTPAAKLAHRKLLGDTPTARLWRIISSSGAMESSVSEFAALAQLVFVMVPGSVEDERRCAAMAYVQDPTRNCLLHEHLGLCVRMFTQDLFDLRSFPFAEALKKWREAMPATGAGT